MTTLKILASAYACRPGKGSEPGISWNLVQELAKEHQVWVLTRENNRPAIEAELAEHPNPNLQFVYCDLPRWMQRLNRGQRLVQLHYYGWQIAAYLTARRLQADIGFSLAHHITYVKYWSPSFLSLLPIPFIWGPVGGGEFAPNPFRGDFGWRGGVYELSRDIARWVSELDPFVRLTARRSRIAQATTEDTAKRLRLLGAKAVQVQSQLGLSEAEIAQLAQHGPPPRTAIRFISIGRLLHWKGFHLGLQAFAQADLPQQVEYWIVGEGPEQKRLEALAEQLGIADRVKFWGNLPRPSVLQKLGECWALIHPSLHESGGLVCLEAMAAGRPVICLDLGGPALQVTEETGFKVTADTPDQTVRRLAIAITRLAQDAGLWSEMSQAGRLRVNQMFHWRIKGKRFIQLYKSVLEQASLTESIR